MQGKIGPKIISDEPLQISSNPDVQSEPYLPDNKDEEEEKGDEK